MTRLAVLALRRTLPPWLAIGLLALLVLAARATSAPPSWTPDADEVAGLRALARQDVWSLLFLAAPLLWLHAARQGTDAANAWLAPLPARALHVAAARLAGVWLAIAVATLATGLIGERALDGPAAGWRRVRAETSPAAVLDGTEPRVRWTVAPVAPGEEARLTVTVAPGAGPAATARVTIAGTERAVEARIAGRTRLALAPPPGTPFVLELERVGPGALLVVPADALEIVAPLASDRGAALALGTRAFLLLACGGALAAGLARVMRPALAALVVLALALASWRAHDALGDALARSVPGADLPRAWSELARGLVPAAPPAAAWVGALVVTALGLALAAGVPRGGARERAE